MDRGIPRLKTDWLTLKTRQFQQSRGWPTTGRSKPMRRKAVAFFHCLDVCKDKSNANLMQKSAAKTRNGRRHDPIGRGRDAPPCLHAPRQPKSTKYSREIRDGGRGNSPPRNFHLETFLAARQDGGRYQPNALACVPRSKGSFFITSDNPAFTRRKTIHLILESSESLWRTTASNWGSRSRGTPT